MERLRVANPVDRGDRPEIEDVWRKLDQAPVDELPDRWVGRAVPRRWRRGPTIGVLGTGAGVLVAIAVVGIVLVAGSRNTPAPPARTAPVARVGGHGARSLSSVARTVGRLLDGIPQSGTRLGNPHAPVTVVIFADLECPICRAFVVGNDGGFPELVRKDMRSGFPELVRRDVRHGIVKVVYRSLCTATCNAVRGAAGRRVFARQQLAAYAAGAQHLFWNYAELFYREQGHGTKYATPTFLTGIAEQITGLNLATWQHDRGEPALRIQLHADQNAASHGHLAGTPTVTITGPAGTKTLLGGLPDYRQFERAIRQVR
jgi:protein-disulfide isomerase